MPPSIDMVRQIQLPPPGSPASAQTLVDRCIAHARDRTGLRRRLASAVATFCALDGPAALGYSSQRDYARNALGIHAVRWLRLRRVGALCLAHPAVGSLPFSVIDLLAQRLSPDEAAALAPDLIGYTVQEAATRIEAVATKPVASDASPDGTRAGPDTLADPDYQPVSFTVPSEVAVYLDETLRLATALLGHEAAEADSVDAVVAEASTEIPTDLTPHEARQCFLVGEGPSPVALGRPPAPAARRSPLTSAPMPRPRFRRDALSAARVLDRWLRRLLRRERDLDTGFQEALLAVHRTDAHRVAGYASFADFGRRALDLAPSTLHDHLARARLRQRGDPIASAVAAGTLAPAKAQLVEKLQRSCHVPMSGLGPWIDLARSLSFRGLLEAVRWAHTQGDTDYRRWSNAGFPPPTREAIRASKHPVTEIARDPSPEILADVARTPSTRARWVLRRETLDVLLQLMAGSRARATCGREAPDLVPPAPPAWWCLLHVFVTARRQWSVVEREPSGVRGQVLRRDDYRCAVPVCSQRRSLEVHHIRFRSAGGGDTPGNLVTLCAFHHHALHDGRLRIHGRVQDSAEDLRYELAMDAEGRAGVCFRGEEVVG